MAGFERKQVLRGLLENVGVLVAPWLVLAWVAGWGGWPEGAAFLRSVGFAVLGWQVGSAFRTVMLGNGSGSGSGRGGEPAEIHTT